MANPTTAKPTAVMNEWLATASTVGELMTCCAVFNATEPPRDVVGNVLGVPYVGNVGSRAAYGHPPLVVPGAFTFNSLSDPVIRFGAGTTPLRFPGRGMGSNATNQTVWAVFKPLATARPAQATVVVWGSGADTFLRGISYRVSTAGVITLGWQNVSFTSSTVTLTSGKTYLVSITQTSSTGRLCNVYCYDDQAYVTPSGTGTSFTSGAAADSTQNDAVLGMNPAFDGYTNISLVGDVYACGFSSATFDPGANGYFAALVADPCAAARGTYAGGGALTAGGISAHDTTKTTITINSNRPSGSTPASYQYRLHRSTTPGFTPGVGTRIGSLQSSPILTDSTAVAGTNYTYKVEQTDGTSTVYSTTASTNLSSVWSRLSRGDFFFGVISDSRWSSSGSNAPIALCERLFAAGWRCGFVNMGQGSTYIYNSGIASASWQPNTTGAFSDAVNGQAGTSLLFNALTAFGHAANINILLGLLGVNDAGTLSAAVAATRYGYIKGVVNTAGYTMYASCPYQTGTADSTAAPVLQQMLSAFLALDNGTTCRVLPNNSYDLSCTNIDYLARDDLHYQDAALDGLSVSQSLLSVIDPAVTYPHVIGG